jgi:hypothetical protein
MTWQFVRSILFVMMFVAVTMPRTVTPAFSEPAPRRLLIAAGMDFRQVLDSASRFKRAGIDLVTLDRAILPLAANLLAEIEAGQIDEDGEKRPRALAAFSEAVLRAIPTLFEYKYIHVISPKLIPFELVQEKGRFLGDQSVVSHEYVANNRHGNRIRASTLSPKVLPFAAYVVDAVIPAPPELPRTQQDIVEVAVGLENRLAVELQFNADANTLRRTLARRDVSVLHIDTHGGERGLSIQVARDGSMMPATELPRNIHIPVVLLFGCEGVADSRSFGTALQRNGVDAVISSFAKFFSFGITGNAAREKAVYLAFFAALAEGEDVGMALLRFRMAALREMEAGKANRTLTRHFFILVGNSRLRFQSAASRR